MKHGAKNLPSHLFLKQNTVILLLHVAAGRFIRCSFLWKNQVNSPREAEWTIITDAAAAGRLCDQNLLPAEPDFHWVAVNVGL